MDRDDTSIRAHREQVLPHVTAGLPLVDVRSPGEYTGGLVRWPGCAQEGAMRAGHIPGAVHMPWRHAANDDGTFRPADDMLASYRGEIGLQLDDDIIMYCTIGERSSHSWFVLTHLRASPRRVRR